MINTGVKFISNSHEYFNSKDEKYISVTTLISKYKAKYDADFWSLYKAVQYKLGISDANKKDFSKMFVKYGGDSKWTDLRTKPLIQICVDNNISVEDIIKDIEKVKATWAVKSKEASDRGTRYHDKKEQEAYTNKVDSIGGVKAVTSTQYSFDLFSLEDGFYPELMLYLHEYKLAGQMDKAIITTDLFGNRWVKADDYKTNKKIDIRNAIGRKMNFPLNKLDDCHFSHYCLQINTYLFILKKHGFKAEFPARFTHIVLNEHEKEIGSTIYLIPDMQKEVQDMLNHYSSNND